MRSAERKKYGQHSEQGEIDEEILSLFPSLDFNRKNVHAQKRKGMKTLLKVLKISTNGTITKYKLTSEYAKPRFGGQVAQNALKELEELELLNGQLIINEKGTLRRDMDLTSKGLVACLCFSDLQLKKSLETIIKQPRFKNSKLAFLIYLFNETFARGQESIGVISPAVIVLRKMAKRGFNLELKSECDIITDLRRTEQEMFLESFKTDMFNSMGAIPLALSQCDKETQEAFINQLKDATNQFSDPTLSLEKKETIKTMTTRMTQNMIMFFTSQEFIMLRNTISKDSSCEDLGYCALERVGFEKNKEENLPEVLVNFWLAMQELLSERLFTHFSES